MSCYREIKSHSSEIYLSEGPTFVSTRLYQGQVCKAALSLDTHQIILSSEARVIQVSYYFLSKENYRAKRRPT